MQEPKRLYRSTRERMLAGVCGGLAEYLNIDPTVVRKIFFLQALFGGPGLLLYIVMWIVVPERPDDWRPPEPPPPPPPPQGS